MEYLRWFTVALLLIGLFNTALTRPSETETSDHFKDDGYDDDFQGDDNYEDYGSEDDKSGGDVDDQNGVENNEASTSIDSTPPPPYFEISYIEQEGRPGEDVILRCDVKNFGVSNVVMWYNGSSAITSGNYVMGKSPRVSLLENNAIRIPNVQPSDSNDYFCEILPTRIRLHVKLDISGARLAVFSHDRDVTNRSITFRQGERVEFECRALDVHSDATMKWSLNGKRVEVPHVSYINGGKVIIEDVDSHHAGTYQCLGDDNSKRPLHASVTINVHYAPKVSTHRHHVNTEEQDTAELYCNYKGDPIAFAQWKKDGEYLPIVASDKYKFETIIHEGRNRSIVHVKNVEKSDLGQYECEVKNSLGTSHAKVYLQFEPETPQFEKIDIFDNKVTLQWLVRSKQPLVEAMLDYKINGSHTWMTESVIKSEKHHEHTGIWKLRHELELSPGIWHARVKTKNTAGWSKFSIQHDFRVEDAVSENSIPQDIIYAADITGNTNPNNSAKQLTLVPSFIIACLLLSSQLVPSFRNS